MSRVLWIDARSGAAGDMILAGLADLGVSVPGLRRALEGLPVGDWTLRVRRVVRHGLAGRRADVRVRGESGARRTFADLRRILGRSRLPEAVRDRALAIFRRLLEAEAEAHGLPFERVHLHEAGGIDAIVDVAGTCWALGELGVERIVVSPMTTGWGSVRCEHGTLPVPGPATMALVRGFPVRGGEIEDERLTPTGAAILTTIADAWGSLPPMRPEAVGYGAGTREHDTDPNMLRMVLGRADPESAVADGSRVGEVLVVQCSIDDLPPQTLAWACARLLEAGALDVYTAPVTMKKGRSGHELTVLAAPERLEPLARILIAETSSLGLRFRTERRIELERTAREVETPWGPVRIKIGTLGDEEVQAWPEYEDCAELARRHGVPLRRVQHAALDAHRAPARTGAPRRKKTEPATKKKAKQVGRGASRAARPRRREP